MNLASKPLLKLVGAAVVAAFVLSSCGAGSLDPLSVPGESNAAAIYIGLTADRVESGDLFWAIYVGGNDAGEPTSGFSAGSLTRDGDGVYGLRVSFGNEATQADRLLIVTRADDLGVGPYVWLSRSDTWPDCSDDSGCETAEESTPG